MLDRNQRVAALSVAMVGIGILQVAWGLRGNDYVYAALGATYGAIGVGFYLAER